MLRCYKKMTKAVSRTWGFVFNNYTEEEYEALKVLPGASYIFLAKEIGRVSKIPHLHGCITFTSARRLSSLKDINRKIHWLVPSNRAAWVQYSKKQNNYIEIKNYKPRPPKRKVATASLPNILPGGWPTIDLNLR